MVKELKEAMNKAGQLTVRQQKHLAKFIMNEIKWDYSFRSSAKKLSILANEALAVHKSGKTKQLNF